MDVDINVPNRALRSWLVGSECRELVQSATSDALRIYRAVVARRTGRLSQSARPSARIEVSGTQGPQWTGKLTVEAPYAASHEFGHTIESALRGVARHEGARDLNTVLTSLGGSR